MSILQKKSYKSFLCLLSLFFLFFQGEAQQPLLKNFKIKDGLPSAEVYCVFQDSKGFIWFGSDGGVSKYDGYSFKNYTTEDGLADNVVFGIQEDKHNRIWFRSLSGRVCYMENDSIHRLDANEQIVLYMKNATMTSFYIDSGDTLWCGVRVDNNFFKIAPPYKETDFKLIKVDFGPYVIKINDQNFISGIGYPNEKQKMFSIFFYNKEVITKKINAPDIKPTHMFYAKLAKDVFLAADIKNLFLIKHDSVTTILSSKQLLTAQTTFLKREGEFIWLGLQGKGVLKCSESDNLSWKKTTQILNGYSVSDVLIDNEGGTWYTTLENGVYYSPPKNFSTYQSQYGFIAYNRHSIEKITDNYIITSSKLNVVDIISADTIVRNVKVPNPILTEILKHTTDPYKGFNTGNDVDSSQAYIWIKKSNTLKKIEHPFANITFISFFPRDPKEIGNYVFGRMWLMSYSDSAKYTQRFSPMPSKGLSYYQDKKGIIWLGCIDGLWSFKNGKFTYHGNENNLLKSAIEDIKESADGTYYYATKGNGVIIRKENTYSKITTATGLSSNNCKCLYIDNDSTIWVGAKTGLTKLTKDKAGWRGIKFNLTDNEFVYEVCKIEKLKNTLQLFTNRGLLSYDLNSDEAEAPPRTYITQFYVNDVSHIKDSMRTFNYNENSVKIAYVGLSFQSSGKIYYSYKLDGLDTAWHNTQSTSLQYPFLPSGNYTFHIKATSLHGTESKHEAFIKFTVKKPFWKTIWFISLLFISVSGLIYLWFYYRLKEIKRKETEKTFVNKQLAELEMKALRSQMNPHFIFNAINSIQNYIVKNNTVVAQDYLAKFARLIRNVLENSKQETILLTDEVEALKIYIELEQLRAPGKFTFNLIVQQDLDLDTITIPPLILQPYVENAILHGLTPLVDRNGQLTITIELTDHKLKCTIDDDGIGRKKALELKQIFHNSMGLPVTENRIKLLSKLSGSEASITVEDKKNAEDGAAGTRVVIILSLNN